MLPKLVRCIERLSSDYHDNSHYQASFKSQLVNSHAGIRTWAMRVLVIYAHPLPDSFAAALHRSVVAALQRRGHEVDDCDLYAEGFDPVLTPAERRVYNTDSPDIGAITTHVARLQAAEALVLCFPTWWYGMPAILKGYFDRVWVPGVAMRLPEGGGAIQPALTNIRQFWVVTTLGSPWWLAVLLLREPVRAVLLGGLARLCGRGVKRRYLALYNIDSASRAQCARFLSRVERAFTRF
jgi:NAD(P)H dehydrogenase (quinone)